MLAHYMSSIMRLGILECGGNYYEGQEFDKQELENVNVWSHHGTELT